MNFSSAHLFGLLLAAPFFIAAMRNKGGMGDVFLIAASSFALGLLSGTVGLMLGLSCFILYFLAAEATRKFGHRQDNPASYPLAPFLAAGFIAAYFIGG
ncbi:prepilin peptidase [uncultured Oscillibacter sp.]|uniref:prepilin peptidase n=1 Tax=uncultured Oscillibacter sp. TaxID=876091 RepID=UPI0025CD506C|nr:prepilin peptidase [uncultured Oscillibacter sp.]